MMSRCDGLARLSATILFAVSSTSWGGGPASSLPTLPARIPSTRAMSIPSPMRSPAMPMQTMNPTSSPYRFARQGEPDVRPSEAAPAAEGATGPCNGAPCPPYLRNRANCPGVQADRIHMYNRQNEPNWYRYYRCCQYGYHPTQWQAWPEGWLTCRHPQPGEHPYDYHPPRPDQKQIERERRLMQENDRRDRETPETLDGPAPQRDDSRPEDSVPPKLVPPTNSTAPPPTAGPEVPPASPVPGVVPEVPPSVDPLPMPMPY
jgi:hypothetical protein